MVATITPQKLLDALGDPAELIDVRTPVEFREVHVHGARNVPLDQLDPTSFDRATSYFIICQKGGRGKKACEKLQAGGVEHVTNVDGGTLACVEAGLPLVRGAKAISLERQVRIAAGTLVLLGVALGWFVHPAWLGLAACVGAGLVFAGVTDTCGMGMLLARMPWNQTR